MKIVYCICSIYNPGGMERVLLNKAAWLTGRLGWDVLVVTTDQHGREPFYPLPAGVRMTDLGINYTDDNGKSAPAKIAGYLRRRRRHRRALESLLMRERADVVVSLYPSESSFIPDIKDGSRKVLELHFNRYFRLQYGRHGLLGLADRWRTRQDLRIVRQFDRFVVLTHEDRGYWGALPNICVIPNAARGMGSANVADMSRHRVVAVGRLDYQKGFDRLVHAWEIVMRDRRFADWRLDIFGQGEWKDRLEGMISAAGLQNSVHINPPTRDIAREYAASSMLVMSSHYEGFPMVMVEAMSCGLPVVTFDFKCGPRDIITPGVNGLLVHDGDICGLAAAMMEVMGDEALRTRLSAEARRVVDTYSEETVMNQWIKLFTAQ